MPDLEVTTRRGDILLASAVLINMAAFLFNSIVFASTHNWMNATAAAVSFGVAIGLYLRFD